MNYECWETPKGTIEFYEDTHTYLFNGVELPSITQILKVHFKGKYEGVSSKTLQKASELGTKMHQALEDYETKGIDDPDNLELYNYKFLKNHYKFECVKAEQPIVLFKDDKPIACGRFDQLIKIDDKLGINDFKRTATFDKNYVAIQTTLYAIAYEQTYGTHIDFVAGTHLRNEVRKFFKWDRADDLAWEVIDEYETNSTN